MASPVLLFVGAALALALAFWLARRAPLRTGEGSTGPPDRDRTYPTRDGVWVRSHGEQRIANWLSRRGVPYHYEPEVADGLRPDFRVEGTPVLIEYWGMASEPSYEERMIEKLDRYEGAGYEVVSLFPAHLHELEALLERELAERGVL